MSRKVIGATVVAVFLFGSGWAFGASGEKASVKGIINSRAGDTFVVTRSGGDVTVILTDETTTEDRKGIFGSDKEHMSNVVLIPGLKVDVEGVTDHQGRVIAEKITIDGDDLKTSEKTPAGLPEQVAANRKDIEEHTERFTALGEYDEKASATVHFDVGRAKIASQDKEQLKGLAQNATGLTGYIVEVTGYADSTGSAAKNTKLSEERAKAVVTWLVQQGGVPMRHIVAPAAMGEYGPAASNETKSGRAENRRVEVKLLVNRGISGELAR